MANTFKRVFSFGKIPVRPLGLPAMGTKVIDGRVLTPVVLSHFGRFLVILNEPGRTVHHVGKEITKRQLLQCRASGDFMSFLADYKPDAPVAIKQAPAPKITPDPVEVTVPKTEVESPVEVEEVIKEVKVEEIQKPVKKKRTSKKKKAVVETLVETPVETPVETEKVAPPPDPFA